MSIKVGVRVRPFNQREIELNCRLCVEMQGVTTRLINLEDSSKNRDFAFDYSFWSHDEFNTQEDGYLRSSSDKYADQQMVYSAVGKELLDNAWLGYHCCLFAYGQTGSGKSYSMIGYGANKGIVPISCEEIFKRIEANQDETKEFEVNVSMLEIYNEKVQDLLIPVNKRSKEGLKIREHKTFGVFVEGLTKHYVDTYKGIQAWMEEGNTHRSVAATEMNANSSRAHTIISIEFKQKETLHNKKVEKLSIIYLVDLAGSERVEKTGAAGEVLKQAANINKSLTTLGMVISSLADKAIGKGKGEVIPYRNSCLTRILQNALGGNSKTLMICAISPANDNYEQTLSTLRYADQAKKIQNKAIVNENQTDKMIRELTQQNDKLKKLMERFDKMGINFMDQDAMQKFNEMKSDFNMNAEMMKDAMITPEMMVKSASLVENRFDQTRPHLANLNEDPILSKKIKYGLDEKAVITIGRKNAEPHNDVIVGGVGILKHHAVITSVDQEGRRDFYLKPLEENEESNCYINGEMISGETRLFHEDRLIFGSTSTFLILIPGEQRRIGPEITREIDYELAQEELGLYKKKEDDKEEQEQKQKEAKQKEEQERKLLEKEMELEKMKEEMHKQSQASLMEMQAKTEAQREKYHHQLQKMKHEIEQEKKKLEQNAKQQKTKINQKNYLQTRLTKYIPKTIEINLIAKEFKRNITMSVKLCLLPDEFELKGPMDSQRKMKTIKIHVDNRELGYSYNWDIEKFNERYYSIKDLWEKYLETNEMPSIANHQDPFWDPPASTQIGSGFLTMLSLAYLLDNESELAMVAENGECGSLFVNLIPTDSTGQINLSDQLEENDQEVQPEHLIGKPFNFTVVIDKATIPDNYENIYVEYILKLNSDDKETFRTAMVNKKTKVPVFSYSKNHRINSVTTEMVQLLKENHLCFKVFGQQSAKAVVKEDPKPKLAPQAPKPVGSPAKGLTTQGASQPQQKGAVIVSKEQAQLQQKRKLEESKKAAEKKKKEEACLLF